MADPSFAVRLSDYAWALLQYWWLLVSGGVLVIEPLIESALPGSFKNFLNRRWPREKRHLHFRWASVMALMIASFLAFNDLNSRYRKLEGNFQVVLGERDEARRLTKESESRKTEPIPLAPRQSSKLYWGSLTLDETLRLRAELRNVSRTALPATKHNLGRLKLTQAQVTILCNDGFCSDLAGGLVESFTGVGITAKLSVAIVRSDDGLRIRPDSKSTREIAGAIERATNGRLLVSIGPGEPDEGVIISIGKKTD